MAIILPLMCLIGGAILALGNYWDWKKNSKKIKIENAKFYRLFKIQSIRGISTGIALILVGVFFAYWSKFKL